MMFIKGYNIDKKEDIGIIIIQVELYNNFQSFYEINHKLKEKGKISMTFLYDVEDMPGCFCEYHETEYIDVGDDFNSDNYLITSSTNSEGRVIIVCIPKVIINIK